MIRVLNIISDSNIGGAGHVLLNYARCCDWASFHTAVALPRGGLLKPPLEELGVRVYEVDGLADRSYHKDDVKALTRLIREADPDLVHTHGALSGRIAAKRCGKPVVYTRHSAFPVPAKLRYPPGRWLNWWINEHYAERIIAVSPAAADNLAEAGVSPKHIVVIMNGVSPLRGAEPVVRAELRARCGFAPEDFVVGIPARIEPYKGQTLLVEAAAELLSQGRRVKLLFAGRGSGEQELRRRAETLLPPGTAHFAGFVEQVEQVFWCMDAQASTSTDSEACSLSLLEGMSMGLPAIVSNVGGNPQLIQHGENGLVFENRNVSALAGCIARLMDSPEELARMHRRSEEIFRQKFTAEVFARNVEAVYRSVLEERRHG